MLLPPISVTCHGDVVCAVWPWRILVSEESTLEVNKKTLVEDRLGQENKRQK